MRYIYLGFIFAIFIFIYLFYEGYLVALLVLAFMVLFHEWGHFLAARLCGVRVEVFSVGFGKKEWCLATFQRRQTEYRLAPILLGGYVKMLGQDDLDPKKIDSSPDSYTSQPPHKRIFILFAGPFANLLLGFLALVAVYSIGREELAPIIASPKPETPAFKAGLQMGDEILAINGIEVKSWEEMSQIIQKQEQTQIDLTLLRTGVEIQKQVNLEFQTLPNLFKEPTPRLVLGVTPLPFTAIKAPKLGSPAQILGLQKNDIITAINKQKVYNFEQIASIISKEENKNKLFTIDLMRQDREISLESKIDNLSTFGIQPLAQSIRINNYGLLGSIQKGFDESLKMSSLMLVGLEKLIVGIVPTSEVGGVVMIMQITSTAAESSLVALLSIAALISLNLGIINLLPIPMLDGGHILFNLYELIFRRALSQEVLYRFTLVGAAIVMGLMMLGLYNDVNRILQ
ncbi:RIP metalloprotease RseP [Helicobacter monodelphidis]|uniref:RIP metalloprotease RseP n=1 Tax=Helicobacter sp. 15-1451 TaxID=2004995 RepID=UPI000DCF0D19|nr:RIP metalloprotease RseP [Helicobacter sp. 15-1451]RAX56610.1 RIP metalloprotease RseP [Helicobacter sp. 15-1451]